MARTAALVAHQQPQSDPNLLFSLISFQNNAHRGSRIDSLCDVVGGPRFADRRQAPAS